MDNKNNKNNSSSNWQSVTLVSVCLRVCVSVCVSVCGQITIHNTISQITFTLLLFLLLAIFNNFEKHFTLHAHLPTLPLPAVVGVVSANTTPTSHPLLLSLSCTHTHSLTLCPTTCTDCAACMHVCVCVFVSLFGTHD